MNSVPKLFSCYYADCWTENHFSTEFGVSTLNHTHSHTLFWGCVSRWFGRALAWHARGQRFDPAILHQKSTVLRRKHSAFLFTEADFGDALLRLHAFLAFAENRDVPADKRVPITKETAVQQAAVRRSLLLFQFRGMAIRRSAFFTSHAPAHPQAAPKMAPPRISVG